MNPAVASAIEWFRRIYLDGIPVLLRQNDTAFLSFICVVAAIDSLAGYRFQGQREGDRFRSFVNEYFPEGYAKHAENLWLFRCRMLHNFSPAYFTLVHAQPQVHLHVSEIGDTILDDGSFFEVMRGAAEKYFAEIETDETRKGDMLKRLDNLERGGAIYVAG